MKILELDVLAFGRLQRFRLKPTTGMQLIFGRNEQGKSTLMAFIRAMFYGFDSDGRKLENSQRRLYRPWSGTAMGGAIIFEHRGRRLRLERHFGPTKAKDTVELMDDVSGNLLSWDQGKQPGYSLLSMSEKEFVNTVFVGQLAAPVVANDDLLSRLSNLTGTGDSQVSPVAIDERLRQAQSDLLAQRGNGGRIPKVRDKIDGLLQRREKAITAAMEQTERIEALRKAKVQREKLEASLTKKENHLQWLDAQRQLTKWQKIKEVKNQMDLTQSKLLQLQSLYHEDYPLSAKSLQKLEASLEQWQESCRRTRVEEERLFQEKRTLQKLESQKERAERAGLNRLDIQKQREALRRSKDMAFSLEQNLTEQNRLLSEAKDLAQRMQNDRARFEQKEKRHQSLLQRLEKETDEAAKEHATSVRAYQDEIERIDALKNKLQGLVVSKEEALPGRKRRILVAMGGLLLSVFLFGGAMAASQTFLFAAAATILLGTAVLIPVDRSRQRAHLAHTLKDKQNQLHSQIQLGQKQLEHARYRKDQSRNQLESRQLRLADEKENLHEERQLHSEEMRVLHQQAGHQAQQLKRLQADCSQRLLDTDALEKVTPANFSEDPKLAHLEQTECLSLLEQKVHGQSQALQTILINNDLSSWEDLEEHWQQQDRQQGEISLQKQAVDRVKTAFDQCHEDENEAFQSLCAAMAPYAELKHPDQALTLWQKLRSDLTSLDRLQNDYELQKEKMSSLLEGDSLQRWQEKAEKLEQQTVAFETDEAPAFMSDREKQQSEIEQIKQRLLQTSQNVAVLQSEIRLKALEIESIEEIDATLASLRHRMERMQRHHDRLKRVRQAMDQAAADLQNSFGPELNRQTSEYLSRMTQSKYDSIKINRDFDVRLADPEDRKHHAWQHLSGGTIDQVYLALRLAISDQISRESPESHLPLLLDDILLQYDDDRAAAALNLLCEKAKRDSQQILLFSCQNRIRDMMQNNGCPMLNLEPNYRL